MLFRRIVLCALLVGALAGLLVSAVQHWQAIPLIAAAEVFEGSGEAADPVATTVHDHDHDHAQGDAHAHDAAEWAPDDGSERHVWTAIANVLTAIGFGLVLVAAITTWEHLRGRPLASARSGLVWGAAGWICVFGLPTLGLPPELPGSVAAPLAERQSWWLLAVTCGGAGLALLAFVRGPLRFAGLAVLVLPFAVGAPHLTGGPFAGHDADIAAQLQALADPFALATTIATAVQWLALGGLSGWAVGRWVRPALVGPALS
ncbi:CbtA family protein [Aromatoleum toluclasticum]|uniref:CbtA family protein n=1 Tax=Aromatoleum toluclasticum TaxID=92003 RepID=UPI001D18FEDB|nr:CbtA family protein [Aromatoleum toluclasticum]MCC4115673.1 CbtA family protein [Aromatoleum toluclasticum]